MKKTQEDKITETKKAQYAQLSFEQELARTLVDEEYLEQIEKKSKESEKSKE